MSVQNVVESNVVNLLSFNVGGKNSWKIQPTSMQPDRLNLSYFHKKFGRKKKASIIAEYAKEKSDIALEMVNIVKENFKKMMQLNYILPLIAS